MRCIFAEISKGVPIMYLNRHIRSHVLDTDMYSERTMHPYQDHNQSYHQ